MTVRPEDFDPAAGTGGDDTVAIQSALNAAGPGGVTELGPKSYHQSATLFMQPSATIKGCGGDATHLLRSADFGDSLVAGTSPVDRAGAVKIAGIFFNHGVSYAQGMTSLPDRATSGAHIRIRHGQDFVIEDCIGWRLPYGIYLESCTVGHIERNWMSGINDNLYPGMQEGIADLVFDNAAGGTHMQIMSVRANYFSGHASAPRDITYTASDRPSGLVVNQIHDVGRSYGILNLSCEDLDVDGNYFGRHNSVNILNKPKAGAVNLDHRYRGNFFDGARDAAMYFMAQDANQLTEGAVISGNVFNGEFNSKSAIVAYASVVGSKPTLRNFTINDNSFQAHAGTPILLLNARGGVLSGNTITRYNALGVSTNDPNYVAGIFAAGASSHLLIQGNSIGGMSDYNANCKRGIIISGGLTNVIQQNNLNTGVGTWP